MINTNYYNPFYGQQNQHQQYYNPANGYIAPNYINPASYINTQTQQNIPQSQPQPMINWVQGEAGAKSFVMNPNETALLMDSESNTFYIKTTDASGMPLPLRIFDYEERDPMATQEEVKQIDLSNYITREEFENRINDLTPVQHNINNKRRNNKNESFVQSPKQ